MIIGFSDERPFGARVNYKKASESYAQIAVGKKVQNANLMNNKYSTRKKLVLILQVQYLMLLQSTLEYSVLLTTCWQLFYVLVLLLLFFIIHLLLVTHGTKHPRLHHHCHHHHCCHCVEHIIRLVAPILDVSGKHRPPSPEMNFDRLV